MYKNSYPVVSVLIVTTGLILTAVPVASTRAQAGGNLTDCADIKDPERRLACYDALSGRPTDAPASPESDSVEPRSTPSAPPQQTRTSNRDSTEEAPTLDDFGRDSDRSNARIQRTEEDFELIDTVLDIREFHRDRMEITLSSGQVWRQTAAQRFHLNEGEEVRIYPSSFGVDYRLSVVGRAGFIQVRRVDGNAPD